MNLLFGDTPQSRRGVGGHQSAAMEKDEWPTPPHVVKALGEFDLDPCAPVKRPWPTAKQHYTIKDNGLRKPWFGRGWCNPPYGTAAIAGPWLRRMAGHNRGTMLIFARMETTFSLITCGSRCASRFERRVRRGLRNDMCAVWAGPALLFRPLFAVCYGLRRFQI